MTQRQETRVANYYNTLLPIMQAGEILNTETSEILVPSFYDKHVYCYILHYHRLYSSKGKGMFESQDSMADNLGIDSKTINRSIKKLTGVGLVSKHITLEMKGNAKRKHATYIPYDVTSGDRYLFKQKIVVRDENGATDEHTFLYDIAHVKEKGAKIPEVPEDHPAFVEIPDDVEFEQMGNSAQSPTYYSMDEPF